MESKIKGGKKVRQGIKREEGGGEGGESKGSKRKEKKRK